MPADETTPSGKTKTNCIVTRPAPGVRLEPDRLARARLLPRPDELWRQQEDAVLGSEMPFGGSGRPYRVAALPEALHGVRLYVCCEPLLPAPLRRAPSPAWLRHPDRRPGLRQVCVTRWPTTRGGTHPPPSPPQRPTRGEDTHHDAQGATNTPSPYRTTTWFCGEMAATQRATAARTATQ